MVVGKALSFRATLLPGCTSSRSVSATLISAAMRSWPTISAKLSPGLTMVPVFSSILGVTTIPAMGAAQLGCGDALLLELHFGLVQIGAEFGLARGGGIVAEFGFGECAAGLREVGFGFARA